MRIQKTYLVCISALLNLASPLVFASLGGMEGGGGKSIVCRDTQGKIQSAETLDLWEAKNLYGLQLKTFEKSVDEAISDIQTTLKNSMNQPEIHLFPLFTRVRNIMKVVPSSVILKPVDDAAEVALPNGCTLEQLAHYVDDNLLLVSEEFWNALNTTNKAALIAHEAIYRMERSYGATNSRRARKIVGHLFSDFVFENVNSGLPENAKFCTATQENRVTFQFAFFPLFAGKIMTALQFSVYDGQVVFSKKTAVLPIQLPWMENIPAKCDNPMNGCNIAGGETTSNFEGADFISFGLEQHVTNGVFEEKYYFLTDAGRHYLNCTR